MDGLQFHLDGVVKNKSEYTDFDGPLELILRLLGRNKIEIKDIRISLILEQYLQHLEQMQRMDLEIASEFVQMASHLMYIKAKTVLAGAEPVEEMDELKNSLEELQRRREYERIKLMADKLTVLAARGEGIYTRAPELLGRERDYRYTHELSQLRTALLAILSREMERPGIPENFAAPARLLYPIGEKSEEIMVKMRASRRVRVSELFCGASGRSELVASFIAVLELCRSGSITLTEENGEFIAEAAEKTEEGKGSGA